MIKWDMKYDDSDQVLEQDQGVGGPAGDLEDRVARQLLDFLRD